MFAAIGETAPSAQDKPFLFFSDASCAVRNVGQHGGVLTVAAALGDGSGALQLETGATRFLSTPARRRRAGKSWRSSASRSRCHRRASPACLSRSPAAGTAGSKCRTAAHLSSVVTVGTVEEGIPIKFAT